MNKSVTLKITKTFGLPALYMVIGLGLAAILVDLIFPRNPVKLSSLTAYFTGFYAVWFLAEGRDGLKELREAHPAVFKRFITFIKTFGLPLFYIGLTAFGIAAVMNMFRPGNPLPTTAVLGAASGVYIAWFLVEGRAELEKLRPAKARGVASK